MAIPNAAPERGVRIPPATEPFAPFRGFPSVQTIPKADALGDSRLPSGLVEIGCSRYSTAIVTPLWLVTPPMAIVTGTALPGATDVGTFKFI